MGIEINDLVEILDRDEALELDHNETTYTDEDEIYEIDWDKLVPPGRSEELFDERLPNWAEEIPEETVERIVEGTLNAPFPVNVVSDNQPIWDVCAWYQPIHFFGTDFGIFIREECVISIASKIASFLPPPTIRRPTLWSKRALAAKLWWTAFSTLFLHEQYHHKIESLGFRLHIARNGRSTYLPYKKNVYRPSLGTDDCLEEGMANADAYGRITKSPYNRAGTHIVGATKEYLEHQFRIDPPGYRLASDLLKPKKYTDGHQLLCSQVLSASLTPATPKPSDWLAAPGITKSIFNIKKKRLYAVVRGRRPPISPHKGVSPCASRDLVKIFQGRGWSQTTGGKGSHIKLVKSNKKPVIIPANREHLSPGVLRAALRQLGDYSLTDIPRLMR